MARNGIYAQAPYGQIDAAFCALIAEILAWDVRADVRKSAAVVALYALTRCWPASHYPKRERDKWSHKATAAFRLSERELAELTGFKRQKCRTALKKLIDAGCLVELAPAAARGEGRGSTSPTYAFRCHVGTQSVSSVSVISSEPADQSRPTQTWSL
jgi:hypothetical protein